MTFPMLLLDKYSIKEWNGRPVREIAKEVNDMEQRMKDAIGYDWANHHIRICGIGGKPALSIQFYDRNPTNQNHVDFWNARTGTSMPFFSGEIWKPEWTEIITDWIKEIDKGLVRCCGCGRWFEDFKRYSYAGAVCEDCYNPEVHKAPDTR